MGILRGNLSGALRLDLEASRTNVVYFRDGVPVAVDLPALGVSLAGVLAERGELDPELADRVTARARASGASESRIIEIDRVVAEGALRDGVRTRARRELERLFDEGPRAFVFTEGAPVPADADLAVLQPLPIIYAGLARSAHRGPRGPVAELLARWGAHRFRLADTYPRGVDPFEWGDDVERAVEALEAPTSIAALGEAGLERTTAAVVLAALHAADMLEIHDPMPHRPGGDRVPGQPL